MVTKGCHSSATIHPAQLWAKALVGAVFVAPVISGVYDPPYEMEMYSSGSPKARVATG